MKNLYDINFDKVYSFQESLDESALFSGMFQLIEALHNLLGVYEQDIECVKASDVNIDTCGRDEYDKLADDVYEIIISDTRFLTNRFDAVYKLNVPEEVLSSDTPEAISEQLGYGETIRELVLSNAVKVIEDAYEDIDLFCKVYSSGVNMVDDLKTDLITYIDSLSEILKEHTGMYLSIDKCLSCDALVRKILDILTFSIVYSYRLNTLYAQTLNNTNQDIPVPLYDYVSSRGDTLDRTELYVQFLMDVYKVYYTFKIEFEVSSSVLQDFYDAFPDGVDGEEIMKLNQHRLSAEVVKSVADGSMSFNDLMDVVSNKKKERGAPGTLNVF